MELTKLYAIAEKHGITVDRYDLKENQSVSVNYNGQFFVGIDPTVSGVCEKVCLAHELGHCESGSFYNIYSPFDIRGKHERRADAWAIKKLVPKTLLESALRQGYTSIYELSEYFGVTGEFMQKAIEYYKMSN